MANSAKNRLFSGDMWYNKTQGKTMPMLCGAFSFLKQLLSVVDLFRNLLRDFDKICFIRKRKIKKTRYWCGLLNIKDILFYQGIKRTISPNSFIIAFCLLKSSTKLNPL